MLTSQLVSQASSMTVFYAAYNFFQVVVKATILGFSPRVPHGAEPSRGQITPEGSGTLCLSSSVVLISPLWLEATLPPRAAYLLLAG